MLEDLSLLRENLPDLDSALTALSAAEGLTDELAKHLLRHINILEDSDRYLFVLHGSHLTIPRNGQEWGLAPSVRRHYLERLQSSPIATQLSFDLLQIAAAAEAQPPSEHSDQSPLERPETLPWYIRSGVGVAYHSTQVDPDAGLAEYANRASDGPERASWLVDRLAQEQAELGLLSKSSPELMYVHGMRLYREGQIADAIPFLEPLAASNKYSRPSAISKHLVGRYYAMEDPHQKYAEGIHLLRRSIVLGSELGDNEHLGQVRHTLAWVYLNKDWSKRQDVIFELLEESLEALDAVGDVFGRAQVLHTLGRAYSRKGKRQDARHAVTLLRESLAIGESEGRTFHVSSVLRTLSNILEGRDPAQSMQFAARRETLLRSIGVQSARPAKPTKTGRKGRPGKR
jgi:tetratricopeptide (TPR) repeat protein